MSMSLNSIIRAAWKAEHSLVPSATAPRSWLEAQAAAAGLQWLLAYTTDGILWGLIDEGKLLVANDTGMFDLPGRSLQWDRIQQLRLFGEAGELTVWHGPVIGNLGQAACWQASLLTEQQDAQASDALYDEEFLLWGWGNEQRGPFVRLVEGQQGIVHHPPVKRAIEERCRARIRVRQHLQIDQKTGMWCVVGSRLVEIR